MKAKRLLMKGLMSLALLLLAVALGAFFAFQAVHALVIVGLVVTAMVPVLALVGLAMAISKVGQYRYATFAY